MLIPVRRSLADGDQAKVYPELGLIYIDPSIHEDDWELIIAEALREITGEPTHYVIRSRPRLAVLPGGRDVG